MKKRNAKLIFMTMFLIIMSSVSVFAAEVDTAVVNADKFGILTLLPPVVAIILAFATKNVILSLVLGVMSGGFLLNLNGVNILSALFKLGYWDIISQNLSVIGSSYFTVDIIMPKVFFGLIVAFVLGIIKIKYKDTYLCIFAHSLINIIFGK